MQLPPLMISGGRSRTWANSVLRPARLSLSAVSRCPRSSPLLFSHFEEPQQVPKEMSFVAPSAHLNLHSWREAGQQPPRTGCPGPADLLEVNFLLSWGFEAWAVVRIQNGLPKTYLKIKRRKCLKNIKEREREKTKQNKKSEIHQKHADTNRRESSRCSRQSWKRLHHKINHRSIGSQPTV